MATDDHSHKRERTREEYELLTSERPDEDGLKGGWVGSWPPHASVPEPGLKGDDDPLAPPPHPASPSPPNLKPDDFGLAYRWAESRVSRFYLIRAGYMPAKELYGHYEDTRARAVCEAARALRLVDLSPAEEKLYNYLRPTVLEVLNFLFDRGHRYTAPKPSKTGRPSQIEGENVRRACMVWFLVKQAGLRVRRGNAPPFRSACDAVALAEEVHTKSGKADEVKQIVRGEQRPRPDRYVDTRRHYTTALLTFTEGLSATKDIADLARKQAEDLVARAKENPTYKDKGKENADFLASIEVLKQESSKRRADPVTRAGRIMNVWYTYKSEDWED